MGTRSPVKRKSRWSLRCNRLFPGRSAALGSSDLAFSGVASRCLKPSPADLSVRLSRLQVDKVREAIPPRPRKKSCPGSI